MLKVGNPSNGPRAAAKGASIWQMARSATDITGLIAASIGSKSGDLADPSLRAWSVRGGWISTSPVATTLNWLPLDSTPSGCDWPELTWPFPPPRPAVQAATTRARAAAAIQRRSRAGVVIAGTRSEPLGGPEQPRVEAISVERGRPSDVPERGPVRLFSAGDESGMTVGVKPEVDPAVIDLRPISAIDVEEDEITGLEQSDIGRPRALVGDQDNPRPDAGHREGPARQLRAVRVVAAQRIAEPVAIDKADVARAVNGAVALGLRVLGHTVVKAP